MHTKLKNRLLLFSFFSLFMIHTVSAASLLEDKKIVIIFLDDIAIPILLQKIESDTVAPTKPTLALTVSHTTVEDSVYVTIKGEVASYIYINGIQVSTIKNSGESIIKLDTSGSEGIKKFIITLRDYANNISEALIVSIRKVANPHTDNAFNIYTANTYAQSTCTPLAMENPVGIFVSPNGNSNAAGTEENPLDLQTALKNNNIVQDGDTLWLMEGIYKGTYTSELRGSKNSPIKVKPYPGKSVIIDTTNATSGAGLRINGTWTHYYGIEITSYDGNRVSTVDNSSNPSDITLNAGVSIIGSTNKVINFVSHDNVSGIDAWSKRKDGFTGIDTETYGSVIYNNGWSAQPSDGSYGRGHGHAIYTQNFDGIKKITNNVIFYGFGTGIHAYQTGKVEQNGILRGIENFDIQDNTWFLTGASDIRKGMKKYDCLVGGYQPVKNLLLKNNQGYSDIGRTMLGYASNYKGELFSNENAVLENNYLVQNLKLQNTWDDGAINIKNTSVFHGITGNQNYLNNLGGNDFGQEPTKGKKIFYIKNAYDPRCGRITIFNFDKDANVAVDLSQIMKIGSAYRVHSVFDLYGKSLLSGVYAGGTIDIPMGTVSPPQPYGLEGAINASEGDDPKKLFGVFIITHAGCQ